MISSKKSFLKVVASNLKDAKKYFNNSTFIPKIYPNEVTIVEVGPRLTFFIYDSLLRISQIHMQVE